MTNIGIGVQGVAKIQVLSKGIIVEERPWTENLVLAQGKNAFFSGNYAGALARYCAVGTGTTTPASTDVGLGAEVKRTGTLLDSGTGTASYSDGRVVYTYTHDFSEETVNQNYSELGWSWSASAGNNLFSRVLISGGTVTVLAGQQLRVVYALTWSVTPYSETAGTLTVAGWPVAPATTTNGTYVTWRGGFATMNSSGTISASDNNVFEPAKAAAFLYVVSALTMDGGFTNIPSKTILYNTGFVTWGAYTAGSFTRSRVCGTISATDLSSTAIVGFLYGNGLGFRFTDLQTKSNLHKLKPNGFSITLS
jgi:hypothetical protein